MIQQKILKELTQEGLINYKFLAHKSSFAAYPQLLTELFQRAETSFESILHLKNNQINFENVVEYYFNHDRTLSNLYSFLESLDSTNNTPLTRKIIEKFEPIMVDYSNKTTLHKGYYKLLQKVARQKLTADQKRSVFLLLRSMKIAGISLSEQKSKILKKINKDLSKLFQKFRNNIIDSKKLFFYEFKDDKALREMPESELRQAAEESKQRKSKARYVFTLSPPSLRAILKYCSDRSLREFFYKRSFMVACDGKLDNRPLILKILKLRQTKAQLLGFKNYADYILQERMAKNVQQIETLLSKISKKYALKAKKEIQELSHFSQLQKMEEWDVPYYSEKFKQQKFKIEEKELKKYFPLDKVLKGLFDIASRFFGLHIKTFKVESYYPDLQVFEIWRGGEFLAYYIADFSARASKKGGAWCNHLRPGYFSNDGKYQVPIIINVMNFPQASAAKPPLLSHRDVETLFHEFGHALHLMLSSKTYANLNGFHTEWDFVEFPSQLLENWCWETSSLKLFAQHYQTKKSLPADMIQKLRDTKTFMSGYGTLRQLEFGLLDLNLHTHKLPTSVSMLDDLCKMIAQRYSILNKFEGYRMYTSFDHVFAGGYAAGYYSYIWAEILEADVFLTMKKSGILNPKTGLQYLKKVLMPGAKKEGSVLFKDFMGRNPDVEAYIKKHALDE